MLLKILYKKKIYYLLIISYLIILYKFFCYIFVVGLNDILEREDVKEIIARTKAKIKGIENETEKKEAEARKIGFVCEK